jgi:signal transduction histidine kinase
VTLRARLLGAFAYVLVLLSVALVVPFALNLVQRIDAEVEAEARNQAQLIAASASGRLGEQAELDRLVLRASDASGGRVIVVDGRGRLLADSGGSGLRGSSYASRPEVDQALGGVPAQGTRHSESLDQELLFTAVPVVDRGQTVGAVRVTQSVEAVNDRKRRDVLVLAGVAVAALLLGLAVAWLMADSLSRPLRSLAGAARRLGRGDLDSRAPLEGSTEQREVAQRFNDMADRIERVLEAQSAFVSNASHQLRTPLTGLRLRLEAAARKASDPALQRDLAAAERETERLGDLLRDLLLLARETRPPEGPVAEAVEPAVEAALDRWSGPASDRGQELEASGDGALSVRAGRQDLDVILDNLIENAVKYSPEGGRTLIEWGAQGADAVIAVSDSGPGIPDEERDAVFERFYRGGAAAAVAGTGLGLPIVDALAGRWEGGVSIRDSEFGGARVEVRLPLAGGGDRAASPDLEPAGGPA